MRLNNIARAPGRLTIQRSLYALPLRRHTRQPNIVLVLDLTIILCHSHALLLDLQQLQALHSLQPLRTTSTLHHPLSILTKLLRFTKLTTLFSLLSQILSRSSIVMTQESHQDSSRLLSANLKIKHHSI